MKEKTIIETEDGKSIAAELYLADDSEPQKWAVFSHMMPETKKSWIGFAEDLRKIGYSSIAYDMRGHGESEGGPAGYLSFSDSEHQDCLMDLEAAIEFIKSRGVEESNIVLIGASIGANLSLLEIAGNERIKKAVLISPGLNYRGVEAEPAAAKIKEGQVVLLISANDDNGNSEEIRTLSRAFPETVKKELLVFESGGHGTRLFETRPEIKETIINFLENNENN